eukprot:TRINITY_DN460_c0_g1_i1.p1 TRINITY_DN460_c0_g1~~TRINITY_DN460_c0_g1_i1.p1  ORF type:complete len:636 (-),score=94.46 TRINITY_DN460_c0_g1_i1:88-1968(-)
MAEASVAAAAAVGSAELNFTPCVSKVGKAYAQLFSAGGTHKRKQKKARRRRRQAELTLDTQSEEPLDSGVLDLDREQPIASSPRVSHNITPLLLEDDDDAERDDADSDTQIPEVASLSPSQYAEPAYAKQDKHSDLQGEKRTKSQGTLNQSSVGFLSSTERFPSNIVQVAPPVGHYDVRFSAVDKHKKVADFRTTARSSSPGGSLGVGTLSGSLDDTFDSSIALDATTENILQDTQSHTQAALTPQLAQAEPQTPARQLRPQTVSVFGERVLPARHAVFMSNTERMPRLHQLTTANVVYHPNYNRVERRACRANFSDLARNPPVFSHTAVISHLHSAVYHPETPRPHTSVLDFSKQCSRENWMGYKGDLIVDRFYELERTQPKVTTLSFAKQVSREQRVKASGYAQPQLVDPSDPYAPCYNAVEARQGALVSMAKQLSRTASAPTTSGSGSTLQPSYTQVERRPHTSVDMSRTTRRKDPPTALAASADYTPKVDAVMPRTSQAPDLSKATSREKEASRFATELGHTDKMYDVLDECVRRSPPSITLDRMVTRERHFKTPQPPCGAVRLPPPFRPHLHRTSCTTHTGHKNGHPPQTLARQLDVLQLLLLTKAYLLGHWATQRLPGNK